MKRDGALGKARAGRSLPRLESLLRRMRIATLDRHEARTRESLIAAGPSVADRQQDLLAFYRHYEELVDVLCDAAQIGPAEHLEPDYQRLRTWIQDHYSCVRKYVVAFLMYSPADAALSLALNGRAADAFEVLVAAPTLDDFLSADDGEMISRISRTRHALNLYGEHLRQLAAQGQP